MKKKDLRASSSGAVATGAAAAGAASFGAMAVGAMALGAVAVGALAVGRVFVHRAKLRRVEIDELAVGRLTIGHGALTIIARVRAAPGRGDDLRRLISGARHLIGPSGTLLAHRSDVDPDFFLLQASWWSGASDSASDKRPALFDALFRDAAARGLLAASSEDPVPLEVYRSI